jgi:hypothetical protein
MAGSAKDARADGAVQGDGAEAELADFLAQSGVRAP